MTGFLLLFLLGIWIALLWLIVQLIMKFIKQKRLAIAASVIFSIFFICLPVGDEIIGGIQFRELCNNGTTLRIADEEKARNSKVFLDRKVDQYLVGYYLPIRYHDWEYIDINSRQPVLSWRTFTAEGGKLMRFLGISETNSPIVFNGNCYEQDFYYSVFKKLNITEVNRRNIHE